MEQGHLLALTGKAPETIQIITSARCISVNRSNRGGSPFYLSYLAKPHADLDQFPTLGPALAKR